MVNIISKCGNIKMSKTMHRLVQTEQSCNINDAKKNPAHLIVFARALQRTICNR